MADPWAFGWTQLLTLLGFAITIIIAFGGFRTFDRWRREKLEERRIEIAFDALTIAHETQFVFQNIRSALAEGYEWADMPQWDGDTEDRRLRRGPYFAIIKRLNANSKFFERVWSIQPKCMALFGQPVEQTFMKLHQARRHIEVAAQMLAQRANDGRAEDTQDEAIGRNNTRFWFYGRLYYKDVFGDPQVHCFYFRSKTNPSAEHCVSEPVEPEGHQKST